MGRESEKFFGRVNAISDAYLFAGCAYTLIDVVLRANAAYNDAKQERIVSQNKTGYAPEQGYYPYNRY